MNYKITPGKLIIKYSNDSEDEFITEKVRVIKAEYVNVDQKQSVVDYSFRKGVVLEKTRALVVVQDT